MFQLLHKVNFDWLKYRRYFIALSVVLMLAGLGSAIVRQAVPGGTVFLSRENAFAEKLVQVAPK